MADLLSKSKMANATPCPGCKSYMPEGTVVCTHCGYNLQTGKAASTRVYEAPKDKKVKAAKEGGGMSVSLDPMMGVWAMVLVYGGLAIGCFALPPLLLLMYVILGLHGAIVSILYIVFAFLDGDALWGIILLIPGVHIMGRYYISLKSERTGLRRYSGMIVRSFTLLIPLPT